jgi:16S rRNA C967 or C1407 C5-methylase (RsmB/RsmF family)
MDRIPAHAAISEAVEMCRAAGEPHASGMVNAILRKVATSPKPKEPIFETTAAFAQRLGHPLWMVERWVAQYGRDAALKICEADQSGALCVDKQLRNMCGSGVHHLPSSGRDSHGDVVFCRLCRNLHDMV